MKNIKFSFFSFILGMIASGFLSYSLFDKFMQGYFTEEVTTHQKIYINVLVALREDRPNDAIAELENKAYGLYSIVKIPSKSYLLDHEIKKQTDAYFCKYYNDPTLSCP